MNYMKKADLLRVADMLSLVYIPALVDVQIAVKVSEACADLARLQQELRDFAQTMEEKP